MRNIYFFLDVDSLSSIFFVSSPSISFFVPFVFSVSILVNVIPVFSSTGSALLISSTISWTMSSNPSQITIVVEYSFGELCFQTWKTISYHCFFMIIFFCFTIYTYLCYKVNYIFWYVLSYLMFSLFHSWTILIEYQSTLLIDIIQSQCSPSFIFVFCCAIFFASSLLSATTKTKSWSSINQLSCFPHRYTAKSVFSIVMYLID